MKSVHKINHVNITFWIKSLGMTWKKKHFSLPKTTSGQTTKPKHRRIAKFLQNLKPHQVGFPLQQNNSNNFASACKIPKLPQDKLELCPAYPPRKKDKYPEGDALCRLSWISGMWDFSDFPTVTTSLSLSGERSHNRENKSGPRSSTIWFGQHRRDPHQHQHHRWYLYRLVGKMGRWKINCWFKSTGGENKF